MSESTNSMLKGLASSLLIIACTLAVMYHLLMTMLVPIRRYEHVKEPPPPKEIKIERRLFLIERVILYNPSLLKATDRINGGALRFTAVGLSCQLPNHWKNGEYVYLDVYESKFYRYRYKLNRPYGTVCRGRWVDLFSPRSGW